MGVAYFGKKEYNEAMEMLDKAIQIDSKLGQDITSILTDLKTDLKKLDDKLDEILKE